MSIIGRTSNSTTTLNNFDHQPNTNNDRFNCSSSCAKIRDFVYSLFYECFWNKEAVRDEELYIQDTHLSSSITWIREETGSHVSQEGLSVSEVRSEVASVISSMQAERDSSISFISISSIDEQKCDDTLTSSLSAYASSDSSSSASFVSDNSLEDSIKSLEERLARENSID